MIFYCITGYMLDQLVFGRLFKPKQWNTRTLFSLVAKLTIGEFKSPCDIVLSHLPHNHGCKISKAKTLSYGGAGGVEFHHIRRLILLILGKNIFFTFFNLREQASTPAGERGSG